MPLLPVPSEPFSYKDVRQALPGAALANRLDRGAKTTNKLQEKPEGPGTRLHGRAKIHKPLK